MGFGAIYTMSPCINHHNHHDMVRPGLCLAQVGCGSITKVWNSDRRLSQVCCSSTATTKKLSTLSCQMLIGFDVIRQNAERAQSSERVNTLRAPCSWRTLVKPHRKLFWFVKSKEAHKVKGDYELQKRSHWIKYCIGWSPMMVYSGPQGLWEIRPTYWFFS